MVGLIDSVVMDLHSSSKTYTYALSGGLRTLHPDISALNASSITVIQITNHYSYPTGGNEESEYHPSLRDTFPWKDKQQRRSAPGIRLAAKNSQAEVGQL